jgi:hypothetical protein
MSYVSLLMTALIGCFLMVMSYKTFFKGPESSLSEQVKKVAREQKINTFSYRSTVQDIHSQLDEASAKEIDRVKEMENFQ